MITHIRTSDQKAQLFSVHSKTVSRICESFVKTVGLLRLDALIGLMHDMARQRMLFLRGVGKKNMIF